MSEFIQIHPLTAYPPACLNRDDLGRPKTAHVGNRERLRISSQCLKRAWRTSDLFRDYREQGMGVRTKEMGLLLYKLLENGNEKSLFHMIRDKDTPAHITTKTTLDQDRVQGIEQVMNLFAECVGLPKKEKMNDAKALKVVLTTKQPVHFSPEEIEALDELIQRIRTGEVVIRTEAERKAAKTGKDMPPPIDDKKLDLLRTQTQAFDIAMFGRMLASSPLYNKEAAVQVSHAFTVHPSAVENDYFSAVDDLNYHEEESGAAHIGEAGFGAGLFYNYVCVNRTLLEGNLPDYDEKKIEKLLQALLHAVTQVSPTGKQNSFASRALSHYVRVEKGFDQPRSLALAFYNPCSEDDMLAESIRKIEKMAQNLDTAYGQTWRTETLKVEESGCEGTLEKLAEFIANPAEDGQS